MVGTYMLDYQVNGRRTRRPDFPPGNRAVFPQVAPHNTYRCAGNDRNGHGTHTAGTIAAASNGTGIVGVAPNVSIAGIKSSNDDGFFFPEMVICSYVWAATHGIDVTNNSYFADPWLFNCRNDADQRAIVQAIGRASRYAPYFDVDWAPPESKLTDKILVPGVIDTSTNFVEHPELVAEVGRTIAQLKAEGLSIVLVEQNIKLTPAIFVLWNFTPLGVTNLNVSAAGSISMIPSRRR